MRKMLLPVLGCALVLGCSDMSDAPLAPGNARRDAITTTQVFRAPTEFGVFVPCANAGMGETVLLSGTFQTVTHVTLDGAGGAHIVAQTQYPGLSGVGLTTGDTYQGTNVTNFEYNAPVGEEITFGNNVRLIGQGPDNNFLLHETLHFTVTPDGEFAVFVDNFFIECR